MRKFILYLSYIWRLTGIYLIYSTNKVTPKQLVSHYFGFGNLNLNNIGSPKTSKVTG